MYKQEVQYRVLSEVRNSIPYMKIGIRFNDYFTQDTYILESSYNSKSNLKQIPFSFYKNNELINESNLIDGNVDGLIDGLFDDVVDYDMKNIFYNQYKGKIIKEVNEFLEFYDKVSLANEVSLESEIRRMKLMSGITPRPSLI